MSVIRAWQAADNVRYAKEIGINHQRVAVMKEIASESYYGNTRLVVYEYALRIKLDEEDWKWFEDHGYKVTRPTRKVFVPSGGSLSSPACYEETTFGIISWGEK